MPVSIADTPPSAFAVAFSAYEAPDCPSAVTAEGQPGASVPQEAAADMEKAAAEAKKAFQRLKKLLQTSTRVLQGRKKLPQMRKPVMKQVKKAWS